MGGDPSLSKRVGEEHMGVVTFLDPTIENDFKDQQYVDVGTRTLWVCELPQYSRIDVALQDP